MTCEVSNAVETEFIHLQFPFKASYNINKINFVFIQKTMKTTLSSDKWPCLV